MAASPVSPTRNRRREHALLGSLPEFRKDRLAFLSALVREQGNVARFRVGPFTVWVFNEPELVHGVLVEHYDAFDKGFVLRNAVRPFSGDGLFISEGQLHKQQRKLMAPAFKPRQVAGYADTVAAIAESAQAGWRDGPGLHPWADRCHHALDADEHPR